MYSNIIARGKKERNISRELIHCLLSVFKFLVTSEILIRIVIKIFSFDMFTMKSEEEESDGRQATTTPLVFASVV